MVILGISARQCLKEFDFRRFFIEKLGWDRHASCLDVSIDGRTVALTSIAQKRGMVAFICVSMGDGRILDYPTRRKIERQVAKFVHEHIIIYADKDEKTQIWQWVKREAGKPTQCREHAYYCNQPGDSLIQKLQAIIFSLDEEEEEGLTIVDVTSRVRAGFDVNRVTRIFYDRFKAEHDMFLKFLKGIPDEEMQRWYASVMLNRLMFIYFIQKKGFIDSNVNYLRDKLAESKQQGKDCFYTDFLCPLFFEGFAKRENERRVTINQLLGEVPFLNGGIFQPHQLEELYGKSIYIFDVAFEKLFNFFDQYQWHLDERPLRADNEINPDVLGYIFEKHINQKQMGAYYTKEDITEYISKNTIIPYLFDAARQKFKIAFEGEHSVWYLLQADPDRYIYDAVKKGVELPLPPDIVMGLDDVSKRTEWNRPAPEEYALPTETWREVVARRKRYVEVRTKLANGEIQDISDLITYNLNICQFAQDAIENCEGPELLRAFWHAIEYVTVLDPTCGSGAFLFAALNILESLYEACLDRMEVFLDGLERFGEKHRPEKFIDFRKVLERIGQHSNRRYFILKSIMVNNLYGVDIMEEAIEICKLRLFLKLVAQVEPEEKIEPLPDIDFNIRAGNTLVGYTTYDEVKRAVTRSSTGQLKMQFDGTMKRIDEKAQDVDRLFEHFRQQQTEIDGEVTPADKQKLRNRLRLLEDELNCYLAKEYSVDPNKKAAYDKWHDSYKPFHWFIEFYGIMRHGGFNAIIGNPPYVAYNNVRNDYQVHGLVTESCSNLYAFVMERSLDLIRNGGRCGLIVPIASVSTDRMSQLQLVYHQRAKRQWHSHFATRPGKLFVGVDMNLTITLLFVTPSKGDVEVFSTTYYRWKSGDESDRKSLFQRLRYLKIISPKSHTNPFPKLGDSIEAAILGKMHSHRKKLAQFYLSGGASLYYHSGGRYWRKALPEKLSSHYKETVVERHLFASILCLLNSQLFYWYWITNSNCMDVVSREVNDMPVFDLNSAKGQQFERLQSSLVKAYSVNREVRKRRGERISTDELNFDVKQCKPIIDEIDRVLARHYGFTEEELDFIINYDIKYRMGKGTEE